MSIETPNCVSHPFREFTDPEIPGFELLFDGPVARHQFNFPDGNPVTIRTSEVRRLEDVGSFPSGGFNIHEWYARRDDGTLQLNHFHLEILPQLDRTTYMFINGRLMKTTEGPERRQKSMALRDAFPTVRICPDTALSLVANDELYFSFTKDGNVIVNKDRNKALVTDNSTNPPVYRFASYVTELVDDSSDEEYKVRVLGAVYNPDITSLKQKLAVPIATGKMRANNAATNGIINSIAHLEVSLVKKQE